MLRDSLLFLFSLCFPFSIPPLPPWWLPYLFFEPPLLSLKLKIHFYSDIFYVPKWTHFVFYRPLSPFLFSRLMMGRLPLHPPWPRTITALYLCPGIIIIRAPSTSKIVLVWVMDHMVTMAVCLMKVCPCKNQHVSSYMKGLWSNIHVHVSYSSSFYSEWLSTFHSPVPPTHWPPLPPFIHQLCILLSSCILTLGSSDLYSPCKSQCAPFLLVWDLSPDPTILLLGIVPGDKPSNQGPGLYVLSSVSDTIHPVPKAGRLRGLFSFLVPPSTFLKLEK